jgi:hypothetical protein
MDRVANLAHARPALSAAGVAREGLWAILHLKVDVYTSRNKAMMKKLPLHHGGKILAGLAELQVQENVQISVSPVCAFQSVSNAESTCIMLTSRSRILLDKLKVAPLVKQVLSFYGRSQKCCSRQKLSQKSTAQILTACFFKIQFNNITDLTYRIWLCQAAVSQHRR